MTDNEIRIAIAEKCGWKWYRRGLWADKPHRSLYHPLLFPEYTNSLKLADMTERQCNPVFIWREGLVPDYPNDLNAMHSAVFELKVGSIDEPDEYEKYCEWVKVITGDDGIDATARQRAEAFCRTLGLWKD